MTESTTPARNNGNDDIVRVMIVEDSPIVQKVISAMLSMDPAIRVVATAENGEIAVNLFKRSSPDDIEVDVVLLDIEMPVMDGLTALPLIIQQSPCTKVIMVSTLTERNADTSIKALALGAADYIPKPAGDITSDHLPEFQQELVRKVGALGYVAKKRRKNENRKRELERMHNRPAVARRNPEPLPQQALPDIPLRTLPSYLRPDALAICCSTGGPQALGVFFQALKGKKINMPVFIAQHMPAEFTRSLAKQLGSVSGIPCTEAVNRGKVEPGHIYVAPGDYHMIVRRDGEELVTRTNQEPPENFCRPSAEPMLRSLVEVYGSKLLVLFLTGMGSDGLTGATLVVERGGTIIAQDEASSVVWGMPGAVARAGLCSELAPLSKLPEIIVEFSQGRIV